VSSTLYRLGRWAYGHKVRVLLVWLVVMVLAGSAAALLMEETDNTFTLPGTESGDALTSLSHTFPQVSGTSARLVVVAPDGAKVTDDDIKGPIEDAVAAFGTVDHVSAVTDPFSEQVSGLVSDDGSAAIVTVQIAAQGSTLPPEDKQALIDVETTLQDALPDGATAALGGDLFSLTIPALGTSEMLGVAVAVVVLFITFGSVIAAGLPLATALLGVAISVACIYASTRFTTISSVSPVLAMMLGLAVGIDYTLFIVSRHRAQLEGGMEPQESTARAVATSGSAVVFAGLTVMIALAGLFVVGMPFLTVMGVAAAGAVGIAVLIAVTLTPALLGFAGERLRPRKARRALAAQASAQAALDEATQAAPGEPTHDEATEVGLGGTPVHPNRFFLGWVKAATRFPVVTILLVVVGLGAVALPALDLRLALPDASTQPEGSRSRVTYDLVKDHFGPGFNGPLIVTGTIVGSTDPLDLMKEIGDEIATLPGVAAVPLATPNMDATVGIVQVIPTSGPDTTETKDLVAEIRAQHQHFLDEYGVDLKVTGLTAAQIDISTLLGDAMLPFALLVVGLSFVLLTMVFRSLWVPATAALGYLLSVAAAFGVVAMVFEKGWGAALLNVDNAPMPVISFLPIILMGVLFGLAMDYEVFLVSRMREDYVHGGDARAAVRSGFLASAKVVTAAATIMFVVFGAFVPQGDIYIKPIALGLAAGVAIDAFVVRMTLMPAVLHLLGRHAWAFPKGLDRVLPGFDVEGEGLAAELRLADWPEPGATDAVVASGLALHAPDGSALYDDVALRLPAGGTLVVAGPHRSGRTALVLTIAGRAHADAGTLKVDGLVLPVRAADVRSRVALASMARRADPAGELRAALGAGVPIVVIDDLDTVSDPVQRAACRAALDEAAASARAAGRPLSLVVTCLDPGGLDGVLPPGDPGLLLALPAPTSTKALVSR
jgi:RND superfamily putative drug exporter